MLNKTIRVSKEVHDLLSGLARKNDSYNDVIKRLIDNYEEFSDEQAEFYNNEIQEENSIINNKKIKEVEDEKEFQKFIEVFNCSSGDITLNSSFEENSQKGEENNFGYTLSNDIQIKYNNIL